MNSLAQDRPVEKTQFEMFADLVGHLWRGGHHALYWSDSKETQWFPVGTLPPIPAKWADRNLYFGVHPCYAIPPENSKGEPRSQQWVRSQIPYIEAVNCLFGEFDVGKKPTDFPSKDAILEHLRALPVFPSSIIDSGGGYHVSWFLDVPHMVTDDNRADVDAIQKRWVDFVGSDGAAKDLPRVLRIPGTRNMKDDYAPEHPVVTFTHFDPATVYTWADLVELLPPVPVVPAKPVHTNGTGAALSLTDEDLIQKAKLARNGAKFERLWNGSTTDYKGHSEADMALCTHLAWWTSDPAQIERLFGASGLYRDKWADREDYRNRTIKKALDTVGSDGYTGPVATTGTTTGTTNGTGPTRAQTVATDGTPSDGETPPAWLEDGPSVDLETGEILGTSWAGRGLAELLEALAGVEDGRAGLQLFALGKVEALAGLDKTSFATFCTHLLERGVTAEWVRTSLRPAVNETKQGLQAGQVGGGGGWATWTDYVKAAEDLGYQFRLNDLNDTIEVSGARMTDVHEAIILSKLHALGLRSVDVARRAFTAAAAAYRFHPVKEYLAGLQWDGVDHIGHLAGHFTDTHGPVTYADGTQRTVIHAFLRRWLIGACGKVADPRRHQNPMLILDGLQGSGKSYFAKWICPLPELHFEGAIRPDDKDYKGYLTTNFIWEVSELGATMRKADREALKAFVTLVDAEFRPAYGRNSLIKPALASFIGTVNFEGALLSDPTGNRRFWPVTLAGLDWGYSQDVNKHQVWAQAYHLFQLGEPGHLSPEEQISHAAIVQMYEAEDILAGFVLEYFRVEPNNESLFTPTTEIVSQLRRPDGADVKGSERALSMQLASTLNSLGLVRQRRRIKGDNQRWGWVGIEKLPILGG